MSLQVIDMDKPILCPEHKDKICYFCRNDSELYCENCSRPSDQDFVRVDVDAILHRFGGVEKFREKAQSDLMILKDEVSIIKDRETEKYLVGQEDTIGGKLKTFVETFENFKQKAKTFQQERKYIMNRKQHVVEEIDDSIWLLQSSSGIKDLKEQVRSILKAEEEYSEKQTDLQLLQRKTKEQCNQSTENLSALEKEFNGIVESFKSFAVETRILLNNLSSSYVINSKEDEKEYPFGIHETARSCSLCSENLPKYADFENVSAAEACDDCNDNIGDTKETDKTIARDKNERNNEPRANDEFGADYSLFEADANRAGKTIMESRSVGMSSSDDSTKRSVLSVKLNTNPVLQDNNEADHKSSYQNGDQTEIVVHSPTHDTSVVKEVNSKYGTMPSYEMEADDSAATVELEGSIGLSADDGPKDILQSDPSYIVWKQLNQKKREQLVDNKIVDFGKSSKESEVIIEPEKDTEYESKDDEESNVRNETVGTADNNMLDKKDISSCLLQADGRDSFDKDALPNEEEQDNAIERADEMKIPDEQTPGKIATTVAQQHDMVMYFCHSQVHKKNMDLDIIQENAVDVSDGQTPVLDVDVERQLQDKFMSPCHFQDQRKDEDHDIIRNSDGVNAFASKVPEKDTGIGTSNADFDVYPKYWTTVKDETNPNKTKPKISTTASHSYSDQMRKEVDQRLAEEFQSSASSDTDDASLTLLASEDARYLDIDRNTDVSLVSLLQASGDRDNTNFNSSNCSGSIRTKSSTTSPSYSDQMRKEADHSFAEKFRSSTSNYTDDVSLSILANEDLDIERNTDVSFVSLIKAAGDNDSTDFTTSYCSDSTRIKHSITSISPSYSDQMRKEADQRHAEEFQLSTANDIGDGSLSILANEGARYLDIDRNTDVSLVSLLQGLGDSDKTDFNTSDSDSTCTKHTSTSPKQTILSNYITRTNDVPKAYTQTDVSETNSNAAANGPQRFRSFSAKVTRNQMLRDKPDAPGVCEITGSAFMPDGRLVLCDKKNTKLKLFDIDFCILDTLTFKDRDLFDVTYVKGKTIATSSPGRQTISFVDIEQNIQGVSGEIEMPTCRPVGIAYGLECEKLIVACTFHKSIHIYECTHDGENWYGDIKRSVPDRINIRGKETLRVETVDLINPLYLAMDKHGNRVYITDDERAVKCVSVDGKEIWEPKKLDGSTGIVLYNSKLLVCGSNNIHEVDAKTGKVTPFILPANSCELRDPRSVAAMGAYVVVAEQGSTMFHVYQLT